MVPGHGAMISLYVIVLVALRSERSATCVEHWLFVTTIGLLALGILLGSIALYSEVHLWYQIQKEFHTRLQQLEDGTHTDTSGSFSTPAKRIFHVTEMAAYICLALSLVALVGYAATSDL